MFLKLLAMRYKKQKIEKITYTFQQNRGDFEQYFFQKPTSLSDRQIIIANGNMLAPP